VLETGYLSAHGDFREDLAAVQAIVMLLRSDEKGLRLPTQALNVDSDRICGLGRYFAKEANEGFSIYSLFREAIPEIRDHDRSHMADHIQEGYSGSQLNRVGRVGRYGEIAGVEPVEVQSSLGMSVVGSQRRWLGSTTPA